MTDLGVEPLFEVVPPFGSPNASSDGPEGGQVQADGIAMMYLGKIVELAPRTTSAADRRTPNTKALIKTIPLADPVAERVKADVEICGELSNPVHPPSGCRFRTRWPRAQARCAAEEPPLRQFGPSHHAACHFPMQAPWLDDERTPHAGSAVGRMNQ
jgi:peptide/nickel transport system ATP-binding protein